MKRFNLRWHHFLMALIGLIIILPWGMFFIPPPKENSHDFEDKRLCVSRIGRSKSACRIPLKMGSKYMLMPANYSVYAPNYTFPPVENDVTLMIALWPGLEYRTEENWDEFENILGWGRHLSVLIESLDRFYSVREANPLGITLDTILERNKLEKTAEQYGLFREIYPDNPVVYPSNPVKGANYSDVDDVFYRIDTENKQSLPQCKEYDYKKKEKPAYCNHWVSTVITCAPFNEHPYRIPSCRHYFVVDAINAKVKISYHKKFLPEWAEIQSEMTELLSSFASTEEEILELSREERRY